MRIWPFRRRNAYAVSTANNLRPGEFPANEQQIGADLEQWLPQPRAHSQNWRAYAGSGSRRGSFGVFLLVLIVVAALVYFVYLQPNGITLAMLWNDFVTAIQDLFAGLLGAGAGGEEETTEATTSGLVKHAKDNPPALITSTPAPAGSS